MIRRESTGLNVVAIAAVRQHVVVPPDPPHIVVIVLRYQRVRVDHRAHAGTQEVHGTAQTEPLVVDDAIGVARAILIQFLEDHGIVQTVWLKQGPLQHRHAECGRLFAISWSTGASIIHFGTVHRIDQAACSIRAHVIVLSTSEVKIGEVGDPEVGQGEGASVDQVVLDEYRLFQTRNGVVGEGHGMDLKSDGWSIRLEVRTGLVVEDGIERLVTMYAGVIPGPGVVGAIVVVVHEGCEVG